MRRIMLNPILGGLFLGVCCFAVLLFLDGYYLPYKPCRPIIYPDQKVTTKSVAYITETPIEAVLLFYDQSLNVQPAPQADVGEWGKEMLGDAQFLYSCYGVDINGLTTETGCIYVTSEKAYSRIEMVLIRSEGGNVPCAR